MKSWILLIKLSSAHFLKTVSGVKTFGDILVRFKPANYRSDQFSHCVCVKSWSKWSDVCAFVLSVCCVGHAMRGGQQRHRQQGEDQRRERGGGDKWHGVRCGALPVGVDWESPAALPSPASRLYDSEFEFLSHTRAHAHTHTHTHTHTDTHLSVSHSMDV